MASVDMCYFTTSQIKWNSLKRSCKNYYEVNKMFHDILWQGQFTLALVEVPAHAKNT